MRQHGTDYLPAMTPPSVPELPFEGSKPTPLASNLIGKPAVH
jgi:hypothetical protein